MTDTVTEDNTYAAPPEVSGAINQHTPSYWRLALPALGVRYVGQYLEQFKFIGGHHRALDALAGAWMFGVTGLFAYSTLKDMKNIFAETVAYETSKPVSAVGYMDLFKSDNQCIAKSCRNLLKYNLMRGLANSTFFASFLPIKSMQGANSTHLGVGANSLYLFGEVVFRDRTFFEQLQNFVDTRLNQKNAMGEDIQPIDLLHLYERNAIDNDPANAFKGQVSSSMWKQSQVIFQRMTDLMNHTYQDKIPGSQDNFTLPKFLYMIGHNLIQPRQVEQTLAYVEVANKYGIPALQQVVKNIQKGNSLAEALKPYPITIPTWQHETPPQEIMEHAPRGRKFVEGLTPIPAPEKTASYTKRYADKNQATGGLALPD